jgi:DNA-binding NtrC family response regulator
MTNILLVDDDADFRTWLIRILKRLPYEIDVAGDGREALQCLDRKKYSLLMVDLLMPVVSGFELLKALEQRKVEIPTIIMSGIVVPEVHEYLKTHEKVRILSKPFPEQRLLDMVEELMGRASGSTTRKRKPRKK